DQQRRRDPQMLSQPFGAETNLDKSDLVHGFQPLGQHNQERFPWQRSIDVRDTRPYLHTQRTARVLARYFDEVFRGLEPTNGQFSLLMALNRPSPPVLGEVAWLLATDW
ncbi:MAG: hypothetical protein ACK5AZ_25985, partial [Bryobacteraceae bacterium]